MLKSNRSLAIVAFVLATFAFVTGYSAVSGGRKPTPAIVKPAPVSPQPKRVTGEIRSNVNQDELEPTERPLTQDPRTTYIARQVFMVKPITMGGLVLPAGGTAFLANDERGLGKVVVTNKHICEIRMDETDEPPTHFLLIQDKLSYVAKRIAMADDTDLCIIEAPIEVKAHSSGLFLAAAEVPPYTRVSVYGHPFLRPLTRTDGVTLQVFVDTISNDDPRLMRIGALDFIINPGNSGSPLVNEAGYVVGVIFAFDTRSSSGLYIPLDDLKRFLRKQKLAREEEEISQ